jgi:multidrug efflux pump subunit AcrA (membrane-fusion protein)
MFFLLFSCKEKQETTYPTKSTLTESVYSLLIVQPDSLYQVYAIVGGILDKNLVEEGDAVIMGTALVEIINTC